MGFDPISFLMGKAAGGGGGGGGGGAWTLIGSAEYEVSTTSTSSTTVGTISLDVEDLTDNDIVWVNIRDKAGQRNDYFFGSDSIYLKRPGSTFLNSPAQYLEYVSNNALVVFNTSSYGVFGSTIDYSAKTVVINARYSSSYKTIDGTFKVEVYKLTPPFPMYE